jgi:Flp pilus assembly protein TadD
LDPIRELHRAGRSAEALSACEALLAREGRSAELLAVAGTLALKLGDLSNAQRYLDEAVAQSPSATEARFNLGNALVRLERHAEAIEQFRRVLELDPGLLAAHNNLGSALHALRDFAAAEAAFRGALRVAPQAAHVHRNLGTSLREQGQLSAALDCFAQARALRPDWVKALQSQATTAMELGAWPIALDACSSWLHVAPANAEALGLTSIALDELGQHEQADHLLDFEHLLKCVQLSQAPAGFASLEAFNAALTRHTLEHPTLHAPPVGDPRHHCPTLRLTGEFCAEPKGPAGPLAELVSVAIHDFADELARTLPRHPFVAGAPRRFELKSWSTVLDREGNLEPHVHYASYLSAVYYPKIPTQMTSTRAGAGFLEFGGGPARFPTRHVRPVRALEPREGLLVLFPSYFYHRTAPFTAAEIRVAIAFDTVPTPSATASRAR